MKVLLPFFIAVMVMLWSQVVFATVTGSRASRLLLQSYRDAAELQREINLLVARGYVLFTGVWRTDESDPDSMSGPKGKRGIERILIRDASSPVYRYAEEEKTGGLNLPVEPPHRSKPLQLQAIAEGHKREIADGHVGGRPGTRQVVSVKHLLHTTYSGELSRDERHTQGWRHYTLQVEDGSYPDTPADIDTLQLITDANTVTLKAASNYRVYRGEIDSNWVTISNKRGKHIETITINDDEPGKIYRHTLDLDGDGNTISERLSVGVIQRPVEEGVQRVRELTVSQESPQDPTGPDVPRTGRYELKLDDAGNMTLNGRLGTKETELQLISGTDNK